MLRKLLKHEFRATSRVMLPLYLALLLLSVFASVSFRIDTSAEPSNFANVMSVTSMFLWIIGMIGVCIMSLVILVNRFHTNLMGEQGYLMMTLPAGTHKLIISKGLTALVWGAASGIVCILSVFIVNWGNDFFAKVGEAFSSLFNVFFYELEAPGRTQIIILGIEFLLVIAFSMAASCLQIYAAIATGHSFNRHKVLLSFVSYFAFGTVLQIITTSFGFISSETSEVFDNLFCDLSGNAIFNDFALLLLILLIGALILCAVFYFITYYMMKKHLNLQ